MSKDESDTGSSGRGEARGKDRTVGRSHQQSGSSASSFAVARIKAANKKVRLIDAIRAEGIKISGPQNQRGWSASIVCPLASHKQGNEKTPSFGYNHKYDRFYCFGCRQSGRAVEFLAGVRNETRLTIADDILYRLGGNDIEDQAPIVRESKSIIDILQKLSSKYQKIIQENKSDFWLQDQLDKPLFWVDSYLLHAVPRNSIDDEELEHRIMIASNLLDELEKL